jgi:hypothetical protein
MNCNLLMGKSSHRNPKEVVTKIFDLETEYEGQRHSKTFAKISISFKFCKTLNFD